MREAQTLQYITSIASTGMNNYLVELFVFQGSVIAFISVSTRDGSVALRAIAKRNIWQ